MIVRDRDFVFFTYLNVLLINQDFTIRHHFVYDLPNLIEIDKVVTHLGTHYDLRIRRSRDGDFTSDTRPLLMGTLVCKHVLQFTDGETSIHMPRIANYEYNFDEFDDATRIKVYEKFRKIRSDINLLAQRSPNR